MNKDTRKAEVDKQKLEPPRASQKLALSLYGPVALSFLLCTNAFAFKTEVSYYTVESCHKEGTSGIMANGEVLKNESLIGASWDSAFGTRLLVRNLANNRTVEIVIKDRGPAKRLYRKGRKLDISQGAFSRIADCKQGIVYCEVTEVLK